MSNSTLRLRSTTSTFANINRGGGGFIGFGSTRLNFYRMKGLLVHGAVLRLQMSLVILNSRGRSLPEERGNKLHDHRVGYVYSGAITALILETKSTAQF